MLDRSGLTFRVQRRKDCSATAVYRLLDPQRVEPEVRIEFAVRVAVMVVVVIVMVVIGHVVVVVVVIMPRFRMSVRIAQDADEGDLGGVAGDVPAFDRFQVVVV